MIEKLRKPIIQGGMGVGVSTWALARDVALAGQIGTVSGTGIHVVVARLLQLGDPGGHLRRAFRAFPQPVIAERVFDAYYVEGGIDPTAAFRSVPTFRPNPPFPLAELVVVANFAQVWLAKEGHDGAIAVNFLTKVELPHLTSLLGAMLAGVDMVVAGAGLPVQFPEILDRFAAWKRAEYELAVLHGRPGDLVMELDPGIFLGGRGAALHRPAFAAIITLPLAGKVVLEKARGAVDAFIVESAIAGGHNAPPRGVHARSAAEPVYGPRDIVHYEQIRSLGLPFWIAGGVASPEKLQEALAFGALGIQAGSIFAGCARSGIAPELRERLLMLALHDKLIVRTSALASPTGYPFQVAQVPGTLSDAALLASRKRTCDLGLLRELVRTEEGKLSMRCPAEPLEEFVRKGGDPARAEGCVCLCNALLATIGLGQRRTDGTELPIVTLGKVLPPMLRSGQLAYSASEVVRYLLGKS